MRLVKCIMTESDCYKTGSTISPSGVMWHSTGANNTTVKRYVQPSEDDPNLSELLDVIGINRNNNDWNRPGINKCVHAFIGTFADGKVGTAQCLPWDCRGWHAGTGSLRKSANNTHIGFEICEDDLTDQDYFETVYREAVELTAMLCREYELDPMEDGVIISHHEGAERGVASNHADVDHWLKRFGKTMNDVRKDVKEEMSDAMTQEQFNQMMDVWLKQQGQKQPAEWSKAARDWAESVGLIAGDGQGNMMYCAPVTREQLMQFLYRLENEI